MSERPNIYRDENAWRGYILVGQLAIKGAVVNQVSLTIYVSVLIYLISQYSIPAALAITVACICFTAYVSYKDMNARQNLMSQINEDTSIDRKGRG